MILVDFVFTLCGTLILVWFGFRIVKNYIKKVIENQVKINIAKAIHSDKFVKMVAREYFKLVKKAQKKQENNK